MDDYDVFVSHASEDTPAVRKLVALRQSWGHKVFADFRDATLPQASTNDRVDAALSEHPRNVIRHCSVFVFVASKHSIRSGWMPWELRLADGAVGRVHIYQMDNTDPSKIGGREYLALYQGQRFSDKDTEAHLQRVANRAKSEANNATQMEAALHGDRSAPQFRLTSNACNHYGHCI